VIEHEQLGEVLVRGGHARPCGFSLPMGLEGGD
jgi:hypothetical protein